MFRTLIMVEIDVKVLARCTFWVIIAGVLNARG
jgi:hypothetical protein